MSKILPSVLSLSKQTYIPFIDAAFEAIEVGLFQDLAAELAIVRQAAGDGVEVRDGKTQRLDNAVCVCVYVSVSE